MPEPVDIVVPKWGLTVEELTVSEWLVEVGDEVAEGDGIVELETDKAVNELESPVTGVILEILRTEEAVVEPGDVLGRISPA